MEPVFLKKMRFLCQDGALDQPGLRILQKFLQIYLEEELPVAIFTGSLIQACWRVAEVDRMGNQGS